MSLDPIPQPLDHLVLRGEGPASALILREGSLSYDTLNLRIGLLAAWLTTMGLEHGDRVATWLPKNKAYRCGYISAQVAVKAKYDLWVTAPEKTAMERVLTTCPK